MLLKLEKSEINKLLLHFSVEITSQEMDQIENAAQVH